MKRLIILISLLGGLSPAFAQKSSTAPAKPKLVVGIIVDQMRDEYLHRFNSKFSSGGFKRMMGEGFTCRNNQYHYASTVTGPGHAHVFTGSSPAISGIVGNDWYEKPIGKKMYVAADSTVSLVGEGKASAGKMSPRNLKVTTITDQLRVATQFRSKVIGVAFKDRGAIMPAGHTGQAYWFDGSSGNWITSTYYRNDLPQWVKDFNTRKLPAEYIAQKWDYLFPDYDYPESEADDQPYEAPLSGEKSAVFPHTVSMESFTTSYYSSRLTREFAMAAIENENLGSGPVTDFLTISFSGPDYAGHAFGPQSKEVQDVYLRLDREIEQLLNYLDKKLGKGTYTVFLSADHAVANVPAFNMKNNIPSGVFVGKELQRMAQQVLEERYGDSKIIVSYDNYQLYLNTDLLAKKNLSIDEVTETLRSKLSQKEGIYTVINLADGKVSSLPEYYQKKITNLYNPKRSGEIMILPEPAWFEGGLKGTTHGTMYRYDTHVPLLFFGWGINHGETVRPTFVCDIAPTVAMLLKILEPNGAIGDPIQEVLKK
ncbi:alkaline phosphatase PafA [Leadbetterella sp. DM7]|uniref:alkaline phosphatase PafA n=1 Tax=Leadbetterella sp. DM7 TaxID=3235085 RepID=UPI00349E88E8